MRFVKSMLAGLAFLAVAGSAAPSQAVVIQFAVDGNIQGGGTSSLTGSFLYDTETDMLSDISVMTTGTPTGGLTFTEFLGAPLGGIVFGQAGAGTGPQVALILNGVRLPDLETPGFVAFDSGGFAEFNCSSAADCANGFGTRASNFFRLGIDGFPGGVTGTTLAQLPLPPTALLLLTAMAALGAVSARRSV